jgi:hypothetical protein
MDEVGKRMMSAEMSIEELLVRFRQVKDSNCQLIKKNKDLESKHSIVQDRIKQLMSRVKKTLVQLEKES